MTRATEILLDTHGLGGLLRQGSTAPPGLRVLGEVSLAFSGVPWENLTKFLRKATMETAPPAGALSDLAVPGGAAPFLAARDGPLGDLLRYADTVLEEHVESGTGGTCFSLANALGRILADMGFHVRPVMGDMRHGRNIHCALVVRHPRGPFLLDPGYLVPEPVRIVPGRACEVRNGPVLLRYTFAEHGGTAVLHTGSGGDATRFRYRLRLRSVSAAEFTRHWIDSFDSTGMRSLHLNAVSHGVRLSAHNHNLRLDHGRSAENVKLRADYPESIEELFGVSRSVVDRAHRLWLDSRRKAGKGGDPGVE